MKSVFVSFGSFSPTKFAFCSSNRSRQAQLDESTSGPSKKTKKKNAAITVSHISVVMIVHRLEYYTFAFGYSRIKRAEFQCFCFYLPLSSLVRIVRASV